MRSGVWIEDAVRPAAAQLFERKIAPAADMKGLDDGLGSSSKPDRFSFWWRHCFRRSEKYRFAKVHHRFPAQLWGSMVVTYEIGRELPQPLIL
jgi:hypothetical protein